MNGALEHLCCIVCSARKALWEQSKIFFVPNSHIRSINFLFAAKFPFRKPVTARSVEDWFSLCKKRGLQDIKLLLPTSVKDRKLLGFVNNTQGLIVCYWKNKKTSCFYPVWDYDHQRKGWNILYTERRENQFPDDMWHFPCKTDAFQRVLSEIGEFAARIGFPYYSEIFHKAQEELYGNNPTEIFSVPPCLPAKFQGIYHAVATADVFGAMGSWNDSPPYAAQKMGLEEEYNALSDQLFAQLRYQLMYITNECWKRS